MIKKNMRLSISKLATLILATISISAAQAQTYFPKDVDKSLCSLSSTEFQNWIHLSLPGIPSKIGPVYDKTSGMAYIFPPNGPNFLSNNKSGPTDCDFYKWGAQMFLWLTSTIDDVGKIPKNPQFGANLPYVFNSEFFYRLSTDGTTLLAQDSSEKANNSLTISLRSAKSDDSETIGQAGGAGVLLTQDNSLTYYGVHVNRLYGYFYSQKKSGGIKSAQFPTTASETCSSIKYAMSNGYAETGTVPDFLYGIYCSGLTDSMNKTQTRAARKQSTKLTIPELEPAVDYLSMAVEVKTSWVDANTLSDKEKGNYIRQYINIPEYNTSNDKLWTLTNPSVQRELALVGMHIVGTVEGHPESVWVTIEHKNNAPNSTYYYYTDVKGNKISTVSGPQADAKWLYSNGKVASSVAEYATGCTNTPMPSGCKHASDIVSKDGSTAIQASNVTRLNPWGNTQSITDAFVVSQNTQLISLNRDVNQQVVGLLSQDPRQNYFISGAVWTNNGGIPTGDSYEHNTGSKLLANTTMETFHQDIGCFACHNSSDPKNGLNLSHIFDGISSPLPKITDNKE